jgi:hypothetical protein
MKHHFSHILTTILNLIYYEHDKSFNTIIKKNLYLLSFTKILQVTFQSDLVY